jgi:hypothetical protein
MFCANQFAKRRGYPPNASDMPDDPQAIVCRGGACILRPFGDLLAGPLWGSAGILTAEIDLRGLPRAQYDLDPGPPGHLYAAGEPDGKTASSIWSGRRATLS